MGPLPRINASEGGGGGGGEGGGVPCVGPSRAGVRCLAALSRQIGSWQPLHLAFSGFEHNSFRYRVIRFPPRVAGLFRTQRAHACKKFYEDTHAKELPYA